MLRPRLVICAAVLVAACSYLLWAAGRRIDRIDYVTALAASAEPGGSGQHDHRRELILPSRNDASFHWLAQTERMLETGHLRIRRADYDNAPSGREVRAASPYRWYLGALAWADAAVQRRPVERAVEAAARWADPVVQAGLILIGTIFVAATFGTGAAVVFGIGATLLFPLVTEFFPGAPDDRGLAISVAVGSTLLVLAGLRAAQSSAVRNRWFAAAGVAGGVGVWISAPVEVPILLGLVLGGCLASGIAPTAPPEDKLAEVADAPWRLWALFGALTVLLAWLAEYAPDQLAQWRLDHVHPLYGLGWIAAAELPVRIRRLVRRRRPVVNGVVLAACMVLLAGITVVLWRLGNAAFLVRDLASARLDRTPDGNVARSFFSWARAVGASGTLWTTLAPVAVLFPVSYLAGRRRVPTDARARLAVALGPLLAALGMALMQLRWWAVVDATALVAAAMVAAAWAASPHRAVRYAAVAGILAIAALGLMRAWPPKSAGAATPIAAPEAEEIIERDLATWLAFHAGERGAVVYAPPQEALALSYYGRLRAIGTFSADNDDGFRAAVMIAGASTLEAAQALLEAHRVRYIVVPSWDPFFDNFARLYLAASQANRQSLLVYELRRLNLPSWLRPVAYQMPPIGGFEKQWVLVFEVVNDQSPVVATSRLADFLVEIGDVARGHAVGQALRKYPGNVGALAALAQVQLAEQQEKEAGQTLGTLVALVKAGGARNLPWDRRVAVAVALGRANEEALARSETQRCLAEADAQKLRALSTNSLYNLLVLARAFELPLPSPKLDALALALLPPERRNGL